MYSREVEGEEGESGRVFALSVSQKANLLTHDLTKVYGRVAESRSNLAHADPQSPESQSFGSSNFEFPCFWLDFGHLRFCSREVCGRREAALTLHRAFEERGTP